MLDNINGNEKEQIRQDDKRKNEKHTNLDSDEKEQLGKYEKKGEKFTWDKLDDEKENVKKDENKMASLCILYVISQLSLG